MGVKNQKPMTTFCSYTYLHFVTTNCKQDPATEPSFQIDRSQCVWKNCN